MTVPGLGRRLPRVRGHVFALCQRPRMRQRENIVSGLSTGEVIHALIMKGSLPVLSIGRRCLDLGWASYWEPYGIPCVILPDGRRVDCIVEGKVPYIPHRPATIAACATPSPGSPVIYAPGCLRRRVRAVGTPPYRETINFRQPYQAQTLRLSLWLSPRPTPTSTRYRARSASPKS